MRLVCQAERFPFAHLRARWRGSVVVMIIAALSGTGSAQERLTTSPASETTHVPPKVERYVQFVFSRLDEDADGALSEAEWRQMSGEPQAADGDRDGIITRAEFQAYVVRYGNARRPAALMTPIDEAAAANAGAGDPSGSAGEIASESNGGAAAGAAPSVTSKNGSRTRETKFHVRPSRGLGRLPGWFLDRDSDGDGQLTLREFSADSPGRLREFERLDHNEDGVITPREATMPREADRPATSRSAATNP